MPGYRRDYLKFYQLPNSNLFTHRLLFSREKPLVKPTAPGSLSHIICLCELLYLPFIFRSIKPKKIQKYLAAIYFIWRSIYQIITTFPRPFANFWRSFPKGIDNSFNMSGCEYLLFVCRCCLRSVAWFSYWFDNLGLITEGNTYHRCAVVLAGEIQT